MSVEDQGKISLPWDLFLTLRGEQQHGMRIRPALSVIECQVENCHLKTLEIHCILKARARKNYFLQKRI